MNTILNKKWMAWLVLILLLLNISALGTIIYFTYHKHDRHFQSGNESKMIPGKEMIKELGLNSSQAQVFCNIRHEFFEEIKPSLEKLRNQRKMTFSELNKENPDTAYLKGIADSTGKIQAELKKETMRHYLRIRKICNSEQREKLSALYSGMFMVEGQGRGQAMGMRFRHGWQQEQGPGMRQQQRGKGCIYRNDTTVKQ